MPTSMYVDKSNVSLVTMKASWPSRRGGNWNGSGSHVTHSKGSLANTILQGTVEDTRKRGWPKHRWMSASLKGWTRLTNELIANANGERTFVGCSALSLSNIWAHWKYSFSRVFHLEHSIPIRSLHQSDYIPFTLRLSIAKITLTLAPNSKPTIPTAFYPCRQRCPDNDDDLRCPAPRDPNNTMTP
jgi:hypothetical protein